ncbi:Protein N-acetyltransferase, RimJ/RimL family [Evansella caseinilytica]|uniref:Protein N-acetyltransferase, RimJ/RimL family n=1 Tax=Evansella caseinilytica TaxID=1503961 RepID=A0A1H3NZA0_9BACI|nr:GNAT family N-acetyltransferase [Evansella caseinilytica]SDY94128.1 Protein N-acetyltransferase, RimJ/RimL family [Evansella caseinilytica]
MLKRRELQDCQVLFELLVHPDVFPFVRHQANSYEEFLFLTKQTIEAEERGEIISRTILDEWGAPIGTINLFDIKNNAGFLGTWLGKSYHGKGYNSAAKETFINELFYELAIERIFMRIRTENVRSIKAAEKLSYVTSINETEASLFQEIHSGKNKYRLYEISKVHYTFHTMLSQNKEDVHQLKKA